ncbi:hypothetical protein [Desulfosporosinus sp. OT]|uniref:hypothetical protein n=1 Tax=Desulfosporosinus sp. OT TaxID=913865 RepID=UPI001111D795|nr:hypothetical protein [Desulfosporosinus sp. OT]
MLEKKWFRDAMIRIGLAEIGFNYDSTADKLFHIKEGKQNFMANQTIVSFKDPDKVSILGFPGKSKLI